MDRKTYFGHHDPTFEIIQRSEWGAAPARATSKLRQPVRTVLMLDTGSAECSSKEDCVRIIKQLQTEYMNILKLDDIPWSFLIGGDGNAYEGRGYHVRPIKTNKKLPAQMKHDGKSLDIAYIGNFQNKFASFEMKRAFGNLLEFSIDQEYLIQDFKFRRFVKKKSIREYMSKFKDIPEDVSYSDNETEEDITKPDDKT